MTEDASVARMMVFHVPEDRRTLEALGHITLRHGHLDYILRRTIKTLAGITIPEAIDATRLEGAGVLRDRIRKLAKNRRGEGAALLKLQAILERCRKATDKRNDWIHSIWAQELGGDPVVTTADHA